MASNAFTQSEQGQKIGWILRTREAIDGMEALSAAGRPALLAVVDRIAKVAPLLSDTEKQHVGRDVHRVLGPRGWRPVDKKRMPKGGLFTTAAVFERVDTARADERFPAQSDESQRRRGALERLQAARAIVRQFPMKPNQVDDFIKEKRREAKRELAEFERRR